MSLQTSELKGILFIKSASTWTHIHTCRGEATFPWIRQMSTIQDDDHSSQLEQHLIKKESGDINTRPHKWWWRERQTEWRKNLRVYRREPPLHLKMNIDLVSRLCLDLMYFSWIIFTLGNFTCERILFASDDVFMPSLPWAILNPHALRACNYDACGFPPVLKMSSFWTDLPSAVVWLLAHSALS